VPAAREQSDKRSGVRSSGIRMSILRPSALALLALLIVAGATGWSIARSQTELRTANLERFDGRALVTASFLSAYLAGTADDLGSPEFPVNDDALQLWLQASDLDAVRILDADGNVIASSSGVPVGATGPPPDGQWRTTEMPGLGSALMIAVVADDGTTRQGWIGLSSSALIDLMNGAPTTARTVRLLVSPAGEVVLAQGGGGSDPSPLAGAVSGMPPATGTETADVDGQRWVLFGHQGPSAGWVSFLAIRESDLFVGAEGWTGAASWAVWGLLLGTGLAGVGLVHRLEDQSSRLARLNGELRHRQRVLGTSTAIVEGTNRSQSMAEALPQLERELGDLLGTAHVRWQPQGDRTAGFDVAATGLARVEVPVEVNGAGGGTLVLVGAPDNGGSDDLKAIARVLASSCTALVEREAVLDDLRRSNQELEQFAFVASHDLQEPLRKIAAYTQLLQRRYGDQLDDEAGEFMDYAVDGAKRMQHLIDDLLRYSRAGRVDMSRHPVALADVFDQVLNDLSPKIVSSGAKITITPQLPIVDADPTALAQVFRNLIDNALKFHGEGPPRITIRARCTETEAVLVVADAGIGIPPEQAEQVFGLFQRLHRDPQHPGTGLGLTICRRLVERGGGTIRIVPDTHNGTEVELTLPLATEGSP
jgi:signal transduction histidine kinase